MSIRSYLPPSPVTPPAEEAGLFAALMNQLVLRVLGAP